MALSWNEIKSRALAFSKEWENDISEDAEAKSFWDDFFNVFGISRRRVATFEQQVKKVDDKTGFIDLLWKGNILVEHKSRGKDLDKAYQQAKDYFPGLKEKELPRYILVSDFERFRLYDLEKNEQSDFRLVDFVNHVHHFGFIAGYEKRSYKEQDAVNIDAAELMGKLHDKLKEIGYTDHPLELYLVRLLFCLFADDTNIFEKGIFNEYIELKTNEDGSDLAAHISQLFQVLNTPVESRYKNLDESLAAFPYVNGKLFEEQLPMPHFDSGMRKSLLDACELDWGAISPAIFGSLFQSVMDEKTRRNLGAHYTSEKNILKLIKPLFLDELRTEFEQLKNDKNKLKKLHDKISKLRFLDPACGCGNFLIIAYRELRLLELDIVKALLKGQRVTNLDHYFLLDVDKFYGIEYEEFPSLIAQVAMWLMDHQMNELASESFGEYILRIPLKKSATIVHGNALRIEWQSLLKPELFDKWNNEDTENLKYNYIFGNPPFIGHHLQSNTQKEDLHFILHDVHSAGVMDYVSAWYYKAAEYLSAFNSSQLMKVGFVSTNSITQGEQVGILWSILINKYHIKIHFAHRTFKWSNEARGAAAVYCVIIGFSNFDSFPKKLYEYETVKSEAHEVIVKNINPYLVDYKDILINNTSNPISEVPKMQYGSKPSDGGFFLFSEDEKNTLLKVEPQATKFIRKFISGREFLYNENRYCLWLVGATPEELRQMPHVMQRVQKVGEFRKQSKAKSTRDYPYNTLFRQVTQPDSDYIIFPSTTSETRKYLPLGFLSKNIIISNASYAIPKATLYHFGVLMSLMHMSWMRYTCGRLKSDYRYSNTIVYNNFPWPEIPTSKQKEAIEKAAQAVLDARASFPNSSLADLYDPNTMPPVLVKAHQALDKAVDLCYRSQPFINETKRIEFLFELYDKYTAGLFVKEKKVKKTKV